MTAPINALGAGMGGDAASRIHDVHLTLVAAGVGSHQGAHDFGRRQPLPQQL